MIDHEKAAAEHDEDARELLDFFSRSGVPYPSNDESNRLWSAFDASLSRLVAKRKNGEKR